MVKGVDLSHHNTVDLSQIDPNEVGFVFLKASEGSTNTDYTFKARWDALHKKGIIRGAYHFLRASEDPTVQANHFLKVVGHLEDGDLPLVCDWEVPDGVSVQANFNCARTFLSLVEKNSGKRPIIYTGSSVSDFADHVRIAPEFAKYPLWVSDYGLRSTPRVPWAWHDWTFWQYTGDGFGRTEHFKGLPKTVDVSAFAGSMTDLKKFCFNSKV